MDAESILDEVWLSRKDAAKMVGISPQALYDRAVIHKQISYRRNGKLIEFNKKDILEHIKSFKRVRVKEEKGMRDLLKQEWQHVAVDFYINGIARGLARVPLDMGYLTLTLNVMQATMRGDYAAYVANQDKLDEARAVSAAVVLPPEKPEKFGMQEITGPNAIYFNQIKKAREKCHEIKSELLKEEVRPFYNRLLAVEEHLPEELPRLSQAFKGIGRFFVLRRFEILGEIVGNIRTEGNPAFLSKKFRELDSIMMKIDRIGGANV